MDYNFIPYNQDPNAPPLKVPKLYDFNQPSLAQDRVMAEVNELLETEPTSAPVMAPTVDIPALRERLAILVSTGKCKEAIGTNLTQEQVKRLDEKDVIKYNARYETYVGSKTTDSLIENFLSLTTKAAGMIVKIDDPEALNNELKGDFIINKELCQFFGGLALKFGSALAVVNAAAITTKHVDLNATTANHVDFSEQITEQYPAITEELVNNDE